MVRSIIEACADCRRRFTKKIGNQMMAPLPRSRLQSSLKAFEKVGVDHGGPFLTKKGRGRQEPSITFVFSRALQPELYIWKCHTH